LRYCSRLSKARKSMDPRTVGKRSLRGCGKILDGPARMALSRLAGRVETCVEGGDIFAR